MIDAIKRHQLFVREIRDAASEHGVRVKPVGQDTVEVEGHWLAVHHTVQQASLHLSVELQVDHVRENRTFRVRPR